MSPYVDWTLVLVAFGGVSEDGERGRKEERWERYVGGVHHSTRRHSLFLGAFCSPSVKGDPYLLPEQLFFSEASQEGEKRKQKLNIHLYMCRAGGVRTPKPHSNSRIAYPPLLKAFPAHLLLLMLLLLLLPPPLQSPPPRGRDLDQA